MAENVDFKDSDWYEVLGVPRTATTEDIIKSYKQLARKHHPDKNRNDPNASSRFALISKAHEILTDPQKKHAYDLGGNDSDDIEHRQIDLEGLGFFRKCCLCVFYKIGVPIETEVSPNVLEEASTIVDSGDSQTELSFGQVEKSEINLQRGCFYKLTVTQEHLDQGFVVHARSLKYDRFKVILFDAQGSVLLSEESKKKDKATEAALFFLPHESFSYRKFKLPLSNEDSPLYLFSILSFYKKDSNTLQPGDHLLCIYNDNFLKKGVIESFAYTCGPDLSPNFERLKKLEGELMDKKKEIECFKSGCTDLLDPSNETKRLIKNHLDETKQMLSLRKKLYNKVLSFPLSNIPPSGRCSRFSICCYLLMTSCALFYFLSDDRKICQ